MNEISKEISQVKQLLNIFPGKDISELHYIQKEITRLCWEDYGNFILKLKEKYCLMMGWP